MSLKDIEKLKEKVDKDPNSKLFVPLAEEYRKEGMIDAAIEVLLDGIGRQPGYTSARVCLGKMYFEKGMLKEAQAEFENVITAIPDNLFSYKKLAEIYREQGERELAMKAYKTILKLNAMDEDALASLRDLEGGESVHKPEAYGGIKPSHAEKEPQYEMDLMKAPVEEASPADLAEELPEWPSRSADELDSFKASLFGDKSPAEETLAVEALSEEIGGEDEILEVVDEQAEEAGEAISFSDAGESIEHSAPVMAPSPVHAEVTELRSYPGETAIGDSGARENSPILEDAGKKVAEGNYSAAMNIYKNILSTDPRNSKALQGAAELKQLLKLLGKDKEALISTLNTFLESIKKRRDEFFRRA
jgi:tetratricopeptide (TPR) repeat protein